MACQVIHTYTVCPNTYSFTSKIYLVSKTTYFTRSTVGVITYGMRSRNEGTGIIIHLILILKCLEVYLLNKF